LDYRHARSALLILEPVRFGQTQTIVIDISTSAAVRTGTAKLCASVRFGEAFVMNTIIKDTRADFWCRAGLFTRTGFARHRLKAPGRPLTNLPDAWPTPMQKQERR